MARPISDARSVRSKSVGDLPATGDERQNQFAVPLGVIEPREMPDTFLAELTIGLQIVCREYRLSGVSFGFRAFYRRRTTATDRTDAIG